MKLKVFNINMWLLPYPYSKHNNDRLQGLVSTIKKLKPDIITLQEVPRIKHIKYMKKELPDYYFSYNKGRILNKSALVTLSLEKPLSTEFFPFSKDKYLARVEKLITKGILAVHLNNISVYNVHFYLVQDYNDSYLLEKQFTFTRNTAKRPCLVCGDFNIEKKHFISLNKGYFLMADDVEPTFSEDNVYNKKWWDRKIKHDKKIDYILAKANKVSYKSRAIEEGLSDHYGIYSEMTLN